MDFADQLDMMDDDCDIEEMTDRYKELTKGITQHTKPKLTNEEYICYLKAIIEKQQEIIEEYEQSEDWI